MAVLVFRHVPLDPIGRIAAILNARGIPWSYVDLWQDGEREPAEPQVALASATGLISLGGPMSVNDPLPWLRREEHYIREAIARAIPVLGICLGAQLLAKTLGAKVCPMQHKEIGWFPVRLTEAGQNDPVLGASGRERFWFQWHGETFDLPHGAELLAKSDLCSHQAFRMGTNLYGVQFHPEVLPETIAEWCDQDRRCGDLREAAEPIDPYAHQQDAGNAATALFHQWCNILAPGQ